MADHERGQRPGLRRRRRAPSTTRSCCSASDSPPGKRERRVGRAVGRPARRVLALDVGEQAAGPVAGVGLHEARVRSPAAGRWRAPTISAVSRARGSGEQASATTPRPAAARASSCGLLAARGRSAARGPGPGSAARRCSVGLPVAGRGGSPRALDRCPSAGPGAASPATSTSSGAMLPRLTSRPKRLRNHTCCSLRGASNSSRSGRRRGRSRRSGPCAPRRRGGRCPAVPLSRASAMTFHAPGLELGLDLLDPAVGGHDLARRPWSPTSLKTVNSRRQAARSARACRAGSSAIVPSETSTWRRPELVQPGDQPVDAALADRELGQRPAEDDGHVVRARSARAWPARLPVTSAVPQPSLTMSTLAPATSIRPSTSASDSPLSSTCVRPALARLGAARREVEEAGHAPRDGRYCATCPGRSSRRRRHRRPPPRRWALRP